MDRDVVVVIDDDRAFVQAVTKFLDFRGFQTREEAVPVYGQGRQNSRDQHDEKRPLPLPEALEE